MMVIFFLGIGAGAIVTGLADGPDMIFAGLTMIGLFAAIYHPVGIAWIVASARKRGMSLGINGVFGNAGNSLAPVFVGVMIDYFSWRARLPDSRCGGGAGRDRAALRLAARLGRGRQDRSGPAARKGPGRRLPRVHGPDPHHGVLGLRVCGPDQYDAEAVRDGVRRRFGHQLHADRAARRDRLGQRLGQRHPGRLARGPVLGAQHLHRLLVAPGAVAVRDRVHGRPATAGGGPAGP